jgi:hypothetical protein
MDVLDQKPFAEDSNSTEQNRKDDYERENTKRQLGWKRLKGTKCQLGRKRLKGMVPYNELNRPLGDGLRLVQMLRLRRKIGKIFSWWLRGFA